MRRQKANKKTTAPRSVSRNCQNKPRPLKSLKLGVATKIRTGSLTRLTAETNIAVKVTIDGIGAHHITTGIPFLDHMLTLFSRHGLFDLTVTAQGDIDVDIHHTNEDIGITLGQTLTKALGDKRGIVRYGFFYVPMEDALVRVVLDISNRPSVTISPWPADDATDKEYKYTDCEHFLKSFAQHAGLNMHIDIIRGTDRHHVIEAIFKAMARALDMATRRDARSNEVPSTKGIL